MTRHRAFTRLEFMPRFNKSFQKLDHARQEQCGDALDQLLINPLPAGLHFKPILPTKTYWEARVNRSDRLIIAPEGSVAYIMDVVTHDEIGRWSK